MQWKLTVLLVFAFASYGHGQWLCTWENRYEIVIQELSGSDLSNYQVKIEVPFLTGMQAHYDDLRFTDENSATQLNYYIESYTATRAIVWVKIPLLEANKEKLIYLYYCNPTASSVSNADNTFLFYDDLDAITGWQTYNNGNISIDNTTFPGVSTIQRSGSCDPNGGYKLIGQTLSSFRLIVREHRKNEGPDCTLNRYGMENGAFNGYSLRRSATVTANGSFGFERRNGGSGSNYQSTSLAQPVNNWYRTELTRCHNGTNGRVRAQLFDDNKNLIGTRLGTDNTYNSFDRMVIRGGRPYFLDFVAVANYVCNEPLVTFNTIENDTPVASCKKVEIYLDVTGSFLLSAADADDGSTDCNPLTFSLSQSNFSCADLGQVDVDFIATDNHGNSDTCYTTIVVMDTLAPIITCPADLTVVADQSNCSAIVNWTPPVITDNCVNVNFNSNFSSGDLFPLGTTTVTYDAMDASNNTSSCSFTITIISDIVAPSLSVQDASGLTPNDGIICASDSACLTSSATFSQYLWSNSATTAQMCTNIAGSYSLLVTDAIGCTATSDVLNIISNPNPTAGTCLISDDYCQRNEGELQVQATNGTAPYNVSWTPTINGNSSSTIPTSGGSIYITNIPGGTIVNITVVDANGCSTE